MCILLCFGMMGGGGGGRKANTKPNRGSVFGGGDGGGGGAPWPPGPPGPPRLPSLPPPAPYFTISVSPRSRTVSEGASATYTITLTSHREFSGTVSLSTGKLPADWEGSFSLGTVALTPGGSRSSKLTVSTSSGTPKRRHDLTVSGTSKTRGQSASIRLTVK